MGGAFLLVVFCVSLFFLLLCVWPHEERGETAANGPNPTPPPPSFLPTPQQDLKVLITNAKVFNQKYTLVWRCADALESEVRRVRKAGFDSRRLATAAVAMEEEVVEEEGGQLH